MIALQPASPTLHPYGQPKLVVRWPVPGRRYALIPDLRSGLRMWLRRWRSDRVVQSAAGPCGITGQPEFFLSVSVEASRRWERYCVLGDLP